MTLGTPNNTLKQMNKTIEQVIYASLYMEDLLPKSWGVSYDMKNTYRTLFYIPYLLVSSVILYTLFTNTINIMGILFYLSLILFIYMFWRSIVPTYKIEVRRREDEIIITWEFQEKTISITTKLNKVDNGYFIEGEFDELQSSKLEQWRLPHGLSIFNDLSLINALYSKNLVTKTNIDK